ncbi:alpha/beta fold hydrolase [Spirosoma oryzicola]|uniref:alpha/beta fold hydrolase n=1 Tax=Spirosoma oryzicola TaxID=2898794 RepID=UPI001E50595C|nr:alpha/beta hydrolase [Spirosoma oryzicola]UHG94264.1 alpha/beta hydrolase [Spirosoma oryzicola]
MLKKIGGIVFFLLIMAVGFLIWTSPGKTKPIRGTNGQPLPRSIAKLEAVTINGTTQWLLMRGADSTKPVLLFLHGGPGLPEASLLVGHELEEKFVVVNWDQRGAGKSYDGTVFDSTFRVSTFVNDAVAVSQWLTKRFRQPRIYLMAHSWGTFLGILTVQKQPELFSAYFSISQIANQLEAEQISYNWVLAEARRRGERRQVNRLLRQGPPPYPADAWLDYLMWQRELVAAYGGGMYRANFYPLFIRSILLFNEYTVLDKIYYGFGAMKSVRYLWPAVVATDLYKTAPALEVPYYLFQGTHDYQTPYVTARRYFDQVRSPRKRLFSFSNSAHSPIFEEPEHFHRCLDSALADVQSMNR